jgi:serine/threonine-protein kinase
MPDASLVVGGRPGWILGERYEILSVLGQGAMGIVYRARDRELDRTVAIKTIDRGCAGGDSGAVSARLQQEATAAARLSHPGIVTIYDVGLSDGIPYIVMEYFKGRTLSEVVAAGPLPPEKAAHVVVEVCRALQYAHAEGVIHRDIKSSNIMVDASWRVKLTDFGVARVVGKQATPTGMMVGTPAYIAPEQVGGGDADARSDLFSLGVVLYEALTGQRPFPSDDFTAVLEEVVHLDPIPARERNFAVSPALDAVVSRVMSKDPEDRYADATTFANALTQALADGPRPLRLAGEWLDVGRRHVRVIVIAGLCAAIVAVAAFVVDFRGENALQTAGHTEPVGVESNSTGEHSSAAPEALSADTPARPSDASPTTAVAGQPAESGSTEAQAPPAQTNRLPRRTAAGQPKATASEKSGCVSVNAVPFATVYVDGRPVVETPRACLRVGVGRHQVVFESLHERSPEQVIVVDDQHTSDNPLSVSYDFRTRQFLTR